MAAIDKVFKQSMTALCEVPLSIEFALHKSTNLKLSLFFSESIVFIPSLFANFDALANAINSSEIYETTDFLNFLQNQTATLAALCDSGDMVLGGAARGCEVVSLFLSSDADMRTLAEEVRQLAGLLRGRKACSWWMLWPADFPADWESDDYVGYVPRVAMFEGQRALERTQLVKSAFPHPADLWEYITGKRWMATLAPQAATMRLPACVIATREEVLRGAEAAARTAVRGLEDLRRTNSALPWLAATGGPASINSAGLTKGV